MTAASRVTEGRRFRTMPGATTAAAPEWRPYVYRGTGADTLTAFMDTAPGRLPVQPCGTRAAYERHIRHGEVPCEPCSEASRDRQRKRKWGRS